MGAANCCRTAETTDIPIATFEPTARNEILTSDQPPTIFSNPFLSTYLPSKTDPKRSFDKWIGRGCRYYKQHNLFIIVFLLTESNHNNVPKHSKRNKIEVQVTYWTYLDNEFTILKSITLLQNFKLHSKFCCSCHLTSIDHPYLFIHIWSDRDYGDSFLYIHDLMKTNTTELQIVEPVSILNLGNKTPLFEILDMFKFKDMHYVITFYHKFRIWRFSQMEKECEYICTLNAPLCANWKREFVQDCRKENVIYTLEAKYQVTDKTKAIGHKLDSCIVHSIDLNTMSIKQGISLDLDFIFTRYQQNDPDYVEFAPQHINNVFVDIDLASISPNGQWITIVAKKRRRRRGMVFILSMETGQIVGECDEIYSNKDGNQTAPFLCWYGNIDICFVLHHGHCYKFTKLDVLQLYPIVEQFGLSHDISVVCMSYIGDTFWHQSHNVEADSDRQGMFGPIIPFIHADANRIIIHTEWAVQFVTYTLK
eukprot:259134_1